MQDLRIAYLQANLIWENPQANLRLFDNLMQQQTQPNDLIILPETFTTGFPVDPHVFAEELNGPAMIWMRAKAQQYNAVVCGSILLRDCVNFFNCFIWMRPDGSYETYAKGHVFRMGGEHEQITPGDQLLTVELNGWKIRPMICYDLRFPVWCRNASLDGVFAYDLLLFVANWPSVRSWPWKQLLIARAIENQSYVIGVNRVGVDGLNYNYTGDSCVLDAKGFMVSQAVAEKEMLVEVSLNYAELLIFREKFNVALDWDRFNILHLSS